jgi:hypothetical protein
MLALVGYYAPAENRVRTPEQRLAIYRRFRPSVPETDARLCRVAEDEQAAHDDIFSYAERGNKSREPAL